MPNSDLPSDMMSAETPKDLSRWHSKREVLYNLYIHHRQTLSDVKKIMESDYGFPTTLKLSDYEHVLREVFKYRKNISADEWRQSIGPEIARRAAAGKCSTVFLNGSKVENVDRRIRRSLQKNRSRRCAKAHTAVLPYGVVIRTPSPQPSAPVSSLPVGRDPGDSDLEQHEMRHSSMEFLADYKAKFDWLSSLMDVIPLSEAGHGAEVLSAHLLREECPINEFFIILSQYQHKFDPADLRVFGLNATIGILGKICFDFSNNLQQDTISEHEMTTILDWVGFTVDITPLKTFFAQKAFTIRATWEALNRTVLQQRHQAAFEVLLSVHLPITGQAPWKVRNHHRIENYLELAPDRFMHLINAYPYDQRDLDDALRAAISNNGPIELVKELISTGASPKSCHDSVNDLILYFGRRGCEAVDLALVKMLLEAGAVADGPDCRFNIVGWWSPEKPTYPTDYLLLSRGNPTNNHSLWSLVSSYSDRQQTTVTVPGIFEAARDGQEQLRSYLNSRSKPDNDHDRKKVLELALSEASGRGYTDVLRSLVQFGVDPNVRMLQKSYGAYITFNDREKRPTWYPLIRAANAGEVDTLRVLVSVSGTDIAFLDEQFSLQLDLCALRNMENSRLTQILRLLSTLDLATATRNEILLCALESYSCRGGGHFDPDFGFVNQLLEFGLASSEQVYLDGELPQLLLRAISGRCGIRAVNYLVEQDMRMLSALSVISIGALWEAILGRQDFRECGAIWELLARKVEGFESYVAENSSYLLANFLRSKVNIWFCNCGAREHAENDCAIMVKVKWFLGLGATLDICGFAKLISHASESSMLAILDSVPDIKTVDKSLALERAIRDRHFNLATALIERGAQINDPKLINSKTIALQYACETGAPLWFIKFLVDKGADMNAPSASFDGLTALQFAAENGSLNVVTLLLDHGADVNALSGWYRLDTPLDFVRAIDVAAENSRLDMVHFLLAAGGRSSYLGLTGFDGALKMATSDRYFAVADLLRKHAESHREARMEAETKWLQANPDMCMYKGGIMRKLDRDFIKESGDKAGFEIWNVDQLERTWSP